MCMIDTQLCIYVCVYIYIQRHTLPTFLFCFRGLVHAYVCILCHAVGCCSGYVLLLQVNIRHCCSGYVLLLQVNIRHCCSGYVLLLQVNIRHCCSGYVSRVCEATHTFVQHTPHNCTGHIHNNIIHIYTYKPITHYAYAYIQTHQHAPPLTNPKYTYTKDTILQALGRTWRASSRRDFICISW